MVLIKPHGSVQVGGVEDDVLVLGEAGEVLVGMTSAAHTGTEALTAASSTAAKMLSLAIRAPPQRDPKRHIIYADVGYRAKSHFDGFRVHGDETLVE